MLEKVTNKNVLSSTIIRHIKKDVFTNCLLYSQEHELEIEAGTLFIKEYPSNNLFMLKMRENFAILNFYINDKNAFLNDIAELETELNGKKIVVEIAYKYGQSIDEYISLFTKSFFAVSLNRECLEKNNVGASNELNLLDGLHLQRELINVKGVLDFLKENFNEFTGCIPSIGVIEKRASNNELLVLEENFTRKIVGVLEYSADNKVTIKHLAIAKDYRGKGLAKYLLNLLSSQNKPIVTWTTSNSEAEKIYANNGFLKTSYKSTVLMYGGE